MRTRLFIHSPAPRPSIISAANPQISIHLLLSVACRQKTEAGNPGSEDAAWVDLVLLGHACAAVVVTATSSFAGTAAGMGGHHAYWMAGGPGLGLGRTCASSEQLVTLPEPRPGAWPC